MRVIGLDVHREFAEVAIWERGEVRLAGRVATTPEALRLFAQSLSATDRVAIEATGNTYAIAGLLDGHVAEVVISNPHPPAGSAGKQAGRWQLADLEHGGHESLVSLFNQEAGTPRVVLLVSPT